MLPTSELQEVLAVGPCELEMKVDRSCNFVYHVRGLARG